MVTRFRPLCRGAAFAALLTVIGCSNSPPQLDPISDQQAFVNVLFGLGLTADDPEGDPLSFRFTSSIEGLEKRASIQTIEDQRGFFQWTPLSADVGSHVFDFIASDGTSESSRSIQLTVSPSGEGATQPIFVQPLGSGTTLNVDETPCLELQVTVEDPDSVEVALGQAQPLVDGAGLTQTSAFGGLWTFCPSPEQLQQTDRYTVVLTADDQDNPPVHKEYLVVLRSESKQDCPGQAPIVNHDASDVSSLVDIEITAVVTDDTGIKYEPLLYYSETPTGPTPDLSAMTQLTMNLVSGTMQDGTWSVDLPNPVANASAGSTAQLHYVIVAQDNDDATGTCDHITQAPATSSFTMVVTNPGGSGGLNLCEPCSSDTQCGSTGDNCIYIDGGYHCGQGCALDTDCPAGYYCSFNTFMSIDNKAARQCLPTDYKCSSSGPMTCTDDSYEDNDTLTQASSAQPLPTGNHPSLKSCPASPSSDDEDWYRIVVPSEGQVSVTLNGTSATDLDLRLTDANGQQIEKSENLSSQEQLAACLGPGTYYLHVFAWGQAENPYSLSWSHSAGPCQSSCTDDAYEDDDNLTQARAVSLVSPPYTAQANQICSGDDDFFEVFLFNGETVYTTLSFTQTSSNEDLDVYIYDNVGTNLTQCTESTPLNCDPTNGQSGTSNESMAWPITQTGTYYLVVHGWNQAENSYDMCIGLDANQCP